MSSETKPAESVPQETSTPAEVAPSTAAHTTTAAAVEAPSEAPAAPTAAPTETEAATEPVVETKSEVEKQPEAKPETPTQKFFKALPEIFKKADYQEMWGIELSTDPTDVKTSVVLYKFLKANNGDLAKAQTQLTEALEWRKKIQPQKLLKDTQFDPKFSDLGYVTTYNKPDGKGKSVVTWNIYGAVKDMKKTFGDVEEFIKWRAALMELSVVELGLDSITEPIPEGGPDPYQMIQVHDYQNVKFFRSDPAVRAASKETIRVFSIAYPELLREKFFVNVPLIMGWVFTAMKIFVSPETIRKFHPLSYGSSLAGELPEIGEQIPKAYGGKGPDVKEGVTVKYASEPVPETKAEAKVEEPAAAPASVPAAEETKPVEAEAPVEAKPVEEVPVTETKPAEAASATETKPAEVAATTETAPATEEAKTA